MKTETINVTPQMAADWLCLNTINRPIRRTAVEALKSAFMRGEYLQTHQGIAFSAGGQLIDGQHRLTAISELRDGVFPMSVTRGALENSFQVIDTGVKRNASDSLREDDRRLVESARLIAYICNKKRANITAVMLIPILKEIRTVHDRLISFCPATVKTWSSAPVRVAAVYSMLAGESQDYVKSVYWALCHMNYDAMPTVAKSLCRAHASGSIRASASIDMMARCMTVFSEKKAGITKIQIGDTSPAVAQIRQMFAHLIADEAMPETKKAAHVGAAKGSLQRNFIMAA